MKPATKVILNQIAELNEDIYESEVSIFTLLEIKHKFPSVITQTEIIKIVKHLENNKNEKILQRKNLRRFLRK